MRDYGTAQWEGGSAECDHSTGKKARNDGGVGGRNGPTSQAQDGGELYYRDLCGKCGARRIDNQIGLEETPEAYVAKLVDVFREVRRVLRDDGTVWCNLGDSMLPNKCEAMIPHRTAMALMEDGWICRSTIIWHKPNPMPESVIDRPTKAHEYIFLLSKSARYYYDADAIREPNSETSHPGTYRTNTKLDASRNDAFKQIGASVLDYTGRNKRSVWTVSTKPYAAAHFATYPPDLIEPCILAGSSAHGCCAECGAPWARVTDDHKEVTGHGGRDHANNRDSSRGDVGVGTMYTTVRKTVGWQPTCTCECTDVVPCTVLDPFNGSGTTGAVALKHGRQYIGCELNANYIELAHRRIQQSKPMLLELTP